MPKLQKLQVMLLVLLLAIPLAANALSGEAPPGVPYDDPNPILNDKDAVYTIFNSFISIAFYVLMFLTILFILWAAFNYLTAGGDPEKVQTAQRMLLYAVIAIVIAVLARSIPFIITYFVRERLR